jgi:hypothetical protein
MKHMDSIKRFYYGIPTGAFMISVMMLIIGGLFIAGVVESIGENIIAVATRIIVLFLVLIHGILFLIYDPNNERE